ncbi:hypothetical protein [Planosporangium mesophilum]|uniref:hypothetical protein n=1 Tax=Planosporangium mesophilum TaxID=689768 RepID=UPI0014398BA0|nr:hypothetical protein [Planosporangium mesophilum]NJC86212.1 hypothetical protein [Planosporangium mesophilum]
MDEISARGEQRPDGMDVQIDEGMARMESLGEVAEQTCAPPSRIVIDHEGVIVLTLA